MRIAEMTDFWDMFGQKLFKSLKIGMFCIKFGDVIIPTSGMIKLKLTTSNNVPVKIRKIKREAFFLCSLLRISQSFFNEFKWKFQFSSLWSIF